MMINQVIRRSIRAFGSNGQGLTYATPLRTVLDTLKIDLAL